MTEAEIAAYKARLSPLPLRKANWERWRSGMKAALAAYPVDDIRVQCLLGDRDPRLTEAEQARRAASDAVPAADDGCQFDETTTWEEACQEVSRSMKAAWRRKA